MEAEFRYRGRVITATEVEFIRRLIAAHPGDSRRQLSLRLCGTWAWKQANGALSDGVCRGLLLMLDRAGQIELPAARWESHPPERKRPSLELDLDTTPLEVPLSAIRPLEFRQVRRRTRASARISFACSPLARRQQFVVPLGVRVILVRGLSAAPE